MTREVFKTALKNAMKTAKWIKDVSINDYNGDDYITETVKEDLENDIEQLIPIIQEIRVGVFKNLDVDYIYAEKGIFEIEDIYLINDVDSNIWELKALIRLMKVGCIDRSRNHIDPACEDITEIFIVDNEIKKLLNKFEEDVIWQLEYLLDKVGNSC